MFYFLFYSFILVQGLLISHTFFAGEKQKPSLENKSTIIALVDRYETAPNRTSFEKLNNLEEKISEQFDSDPQKDSLLKSIDRTRIDLSLLILTQETTKIDIDNCITAVNWLGNVAYFSRKCPYHETVQYLSTKINEIDSFTALNQLQKNPQFEERTFHAQAWLEEYHHSFCPHATQQKTITIHKIEQYCQNMYEPTEAEIVKWENDIDRFLTLCKPHQNDFALTKLVQLKNHHQERTQNRHKLITLIKSNFINHTIIDLIRHLDTYSPRRLSNLIRFIRSSIDLYCPQPCPQKTEILQLYEQALNNYKEAMCLKKHFLATYTKAITILENADQYNWDQQEVSQIVLSIAQDIGSLSLFDDIDKRFQLWKTENFWQNQ